MENAVFLNKEIVTSKNLSHNSVMVYVGLRMIMSRDMLWANGDSAIDSVSLVRIAYQLSKSEEIEKSFLDAIKHGLEELTENHLITMKEIHKDYLIDFTQLHLDTSKNYFITAERFEVQAIMSSNEQTRKKVPLLRYFLAIVSTFNHSDYMEELSGKVGGMSIDYIAKQACINNQMSCIRYNETLEKMHLIYVYRSNDKIKFGDSLKQINNCYSRYKDRDLCIHFATDYENLYGYTHGVVKTKKQKDEADNNRRLAAYYNQICMGTAYPVDTVREVKKYIHNKNVYLHSEIDSKLNPKRTAPLSYSEREYVDKLKAQLRDETPIDKLLESLEATENQWGEPDPLDMGEDLSEEVVSDDLENQESNGVA